MVLNSFVQSDMEHIATSPQEMMLFWEHLAKEKSINKLLIYWPLGAWKTHLVKWFAKGLGIPSDEVISPTYVYLNIYKNILAHMDFYRFHEMDLMPDEIREQLLQKWLLDAVESFPFVAIEWPILEDLYADQTRKKVKIEKIDETKRKITIK